MKITHLIETFVKPKAVVRAVRRGSTALENRAAVCPFLGQPVLVSVLVFAHLEEKSHGALGARGWFLHCKYRRNKTGTKSELRNKTGTRNKSGTNPEQNRNKT